jgi:hypothetical protein
MQQSLESSKQPLVSPEDSSPCPDEATDQLCQRICDDLLEEALIGLYLQVHRSSKMGLLFLDEATNNE